MKSRILFAVLMLLAFIASGHAQTFDKAKLDQFFDRLAEKNKAMGTMLITKDGHEVYSRTNGFGQINGAERKPLTAANRFRIASIGKTYTAVMIMQLVEEGKLKLTDTLDTYFPQIPNAQKITILEMLCHRSGIRNVGPQSEPQRNWANGITKEEMFALIAKGAPEFEPDTKSSYSNAGYFVLTMILEKITGKTYAEALKERVTAKLGLADTYIEDQFIDVNKNESLTYRYFNDAWQPVRETHPSIAYGAGQIMSTPSDMAKFMQALFDGKLVSMASLAQMKTLRDGEGLGLVTFDYNGKTFYGNTGGGDNYGTWLVYEPEEKLTVSYATNAKVYPVADLVSGTVAIYYSKPFAIPSFEGVVVAPKVLDRYVGLYSVPGAPGKAKISREGSKLMFQPPNEATGAALEAISETQFQIPGAVIFTFDAAKKQVTIKGRNGPERVLNKE